MSVSVSEQANVVTRQKNKRSVFSRTCAGKRHLESRERGDREGANGGKREGERSERESVVTRLNLSSRHQSINDITPIGSSQSSWNSTG